MTTRPPRPEEENRRDYEFVSSRKFQALKQKREFLEWVRIFGYDYGTLKKPVEEGAKKGQIVVLTVDIQGNRSIRKALKKKIPVFSVFILPPSIHVLRERLVKRNTDSIDQIEKRIYKAEEEIKAAREYDATVINHDLDQTTHEIEALVSKFEEKLVLKGGKKDGIHSTRKAYA